VLALVAYRQPIAKADIDSQRGHESRGPLQQLVRLGLIALERQPDGAPKDATYATTPRFLELFDLHSLEDLPRTGDLQQL